MTIKLEIAIDLNSSMQSRYDAFEAIRRAMVVGADAALDRLDLGDSGAIHDPHGNAVGEWKVTTP